MTGRGPEHRAHDYLHYSNKETAEDSFYCASMHFNCIWLGVSHGWLNANELAGRLGHTLALQEATVSDQRWTGPKSQNHSKNCR